MSIPPLGRLSTRRGLAGADHVLYEGVPAHLQSPLRQWAEQFLGLGQSPSVMGMEGRSRALSQLAIRCRVPVSHEFLAADDLQDLARSDQDAFLDVIDMHLQLLGGGAKALDAILSAGGSAWTVADDPALHLERRVPDEEQQLYVLATTLADQASAELQEAWGKVYGRDPDPSDAWDHAIKAVEFLLHPIVSPTNNKATLGSMVRDLTNKPEKWTLLLTTSSPQLGEVTVLAGMLRLMWGNPDRHGSGTGYYRNPTPEEAEQIVGLAVLVVSWLRKNALQPVVSSNGSAGSP